MKISTTLCHKRCSQSSRHERTVEDAVTCLYGLGSLAQHILNVLALALSISFSMSKVVYVSTDLCYVESCLYLIMQVERNPGLSCDRTSYSFQGMEIWSAIQKLSKVCIFSSETFENCSLEPCYCAGLSYSYYSHQLTDLNDVGLVWWE